MAIITIEDLTFSYDTNGEDIFSHLSLQLSTDWRLGSSVETAGEKLPFSTF